VANNFFFGKITYIEMKVHLMCDWLLLTCDSSELSAMLKKINFFFGVE